MRDRSDKDTEGYIGISPCRSVAGSIRVPGDKSISHRALMVSAMAHGSTRITGLSPAADVASTMHALEALGTRISKVQVNSQDSLPSSRTSEWELLVDGRGIEAFEAPTDPVDVGNSGTTIRLMTGIVAGAPVAAVFTGDASIRRRPMSRVAEPLRAMGADIELPASGTPPVRVRGKRLHGADIRLSVPSAQVKSAVLLAGLGAQGQTTVEEPSRSRDHTERLLRFLGVRIDESVNRLIVKETKIQAVGSLAVPGDLSSAAFLLVAAAIVAGGSVEVAGVGVNPTRTGILDALRAFGAVVEIGDVAEICGEPVGTVTVTAGDRRPLQIGGEAVVSMIDELPLVGILGALAEGDTYVTDAAELRVKESDRVATVVAGLRAVGVDADEASDGFVVHGRGRIPGGSIDPAGDHRIAMAFAVAGLASERGIAIGDPACMDVSYPGFLGDLDRVVVR